MFLLLSLIFIQIIDKIVLEIFLDFVKIFIHKFIILVLKTQASKCKKLI